MSVDLPAFGKPTRPTSASSFSSSRRSFSSPGSPGCTLRGARLVDVAKRALPHAAASAAARRGRAGLLRRGPRAGAAARRVAGLLVDERADRHRRARDRRRLAGAVRALAVLAALGLELGVKAEVDRACWCAGWRRRRPSRRGRRRRRRARRAGRTSRGGSQAAAAAVAGRRRGCRLRRRTSESVIGSG